MDEVYGVVAHVDAGARSPGHLTRPARLRQRNCSPNRRPETARIIVAAKLASFRRIGQERAGTADIGIADARRAG
jgi:hypothetical protein